PIPSARTEERFAGSRSASGVVTSTSSTSSMSSMLHAPRITVEATTRADLPNALPRPLVPSRYDFVILVCRSEIDVDPTGPLAERRLRVVVLAQEAAGAELVDLRIEATVVGPSRQVASGKGQRQPTGADALGEAFGRRERQGQLAPLHE